MRQLRPENKPAVPPAYIPWSTENARKNAVVEFFQKRPKVQKLNRCHDVSAFVSFRHQKRKNVAIFLDPNPKSHSFIPTRGGRESSTGHVSVAD